MIAITEIMYNPPEMGADSLEFIELKCNYAFLSLENFRFTSGIDYEFPIGAETDMGGYVIVAKDSVAFENTFGIPAYDWGNSSLLNSGEMIMLISPYKLNDSVEYSNSLPWPAGADGTGSSLVFCGNKSEENYYANGWQTSQNNTGIEVNGMTIYADPGQSSECTAVGVTDHGDSGSFLLHPNPNNGTFEVFVIDGQQDIVIELYDVSGKVVHSEPVGSQGNASIQLDPGVRNGIYILRVGEAYSRVIVSR